MLYFRGIITINAVLAECEFRIQLILHKVLSVFTNFAYNPDS